MRHVDGRNREKSGESSAESSGTIDSRSCASELPIEPAHVARSQHEVEGQGDDKGREDQR